MIGRVFTLVLVLHYSGENLSTLKFHDSNFNFLIFPSLSVIGIVVLVLFWKRRKAKKSKPSATSTTGHFNSFTYATIENPPEIKSVHFLFRPLVSVMAKGSMHRRRESTDLAMKSLLWTPDEAPGSHAVNTGSLFRLETQATVNSL